MGNNHPAGLPWLLSRKTTPDCTRTRLPKSSNSTSFPGGRATLDSPGISSLPCQSIIVPHCPPSFRHSLNSIRTYIIQPDSSSLFKFYLESLQQHYLYKDNRCIPPQYSASVSYFLWRRFNHIPFSATRHQHSKLNAAHGTLSTG